MLPAPQASVISSNNGSPSAEASATWHPIAGGITAPMGFEAAGITAGLKASGKPDLSLLLAPEGAVCAGSFTTNRVRAACVDLCAERLAEGAGCARAVLTNSGQANACTGERGLIDSLRATAAVAAKLNVNPEQVLICSTGVIGVPIPIDTLLAGLDPLVAALGPAGAPPPPAPSSPPIWPSSRSPWRPISVASGCGSAAWPRARE